MRHSRIIVYQKWNASRNFVRDDSSTGKEARSTVWPVDGVLAACRTATATTQRPPRGGYVEVRYHSARSEMKGCRCCVPTAQGRFVG
jgi:hypothetical protein